MRVTALAENTSGREGLVAEHGLSLLVETDARTVLFDTGQSPAFADNARRLGIDLGAVDTVVISHGHYDHGGGLATFLQLNDHAPVYLSRHAFEEHRNAREKDIGLDSTLRESGRLVYTDDHLDLGDGLELFSCNDRVPAHQVNAFGLTMRSDGELVPDDFRHEQYLLAEERGRRVLFSGCSHKGVLNIEEWFEPDVLIGGFHFMRLDVDGAGREVLDDAAEKLLSHETKYVTCHCTGANQYRYLRGIMGERLGYLACGESVVV